ncbi:ABC transporter permease subunit [Flavobacteriaceae bacterium]|nr:ABC transporter permease subunit [Flavobacteriaceae bacterium]
MNAIFKKEILSFFSSTVGYTIIIVFLLINALLLWFFKGFSNIFYNGYANLTPFFSNSTLLFTILIPVITMKSFADEYNNGTIEILKTLPINFWNIILGKFVAFKTIIGIILIPTFIFAYSIYQIANPVGNVDLGVVLTSYIGLILVATTYTSIGLYTSILTKNSITAFIVSLSINCFLLFGFDALENITNSNSGFYNLGIYNHLNSLQRGVLDTSDIGYFLSLTFAFLFLAKKQLSNV